MTGKDVQLRRLLGYSAGCQEKFKIQLSENVILEPRSIRRHIAFLYGVDSP